MFLLTAGVLSQRSWTLSRRQYQAVAWGFMLSLLFGALLSQLQEWLTPPNDVEWGISEGAFLGIILDARRHCALRAREHAEGW